MSIAPKKVVVNADCARYDRLKDWLRDNEVKLAEATLNASCLSGHALALYPACEGGCFAYGPGCFPATDPVEPVYVLGDTHGYFDACLAIFETILEMARQNGEGAPVVYLLGDIVDRNDEGCMLECALILAILQRALPEEFAEFNTLRLGIVKGDHDVGLMYEEPYAPETRFQAMVSPADYCDWLNKRLDDGGDENATKIGRAWIHLMKFCPAATFLEKSGTLLAHGGVPREDLQKRFREGEPFLLQSKAFEQDFAWCRMVDAKKKLLNRGSKTSEIGGLEFDSFCKTVFPAESQDGTPATKVRRFIFGHQHPVTGFDQYVKFYNGYEAICIASFPDEAVFGGPTIPHFVRIASGADGESVDVYCLAKPDPVPEAATESVALETSADAATAAAPSDGAVPAPAVPAVPLEGAVSAPAAPAAPSEGAVSAPAAPTAPLEGAVSAPAALTTPLESATPAPVAPAMPDDAKPIQEPTAAEMPAATVSESALADAEDDGVPLG